MNLIRSDKIDAKQMAKICQYAINSVIFAGLVIFCYIYMMEDAIEKSNRKVYSLIFVLSVLGLPGYLGKAKLGIGI